MRGQQGVVGTGDYGGDDGENRGVPFRSPKRAMTVLHDFFFGNWLGRRERDVLSDAS